MSWLQTNIEFLKGVGTARAEMLKKEMGIFTFHDLLFHFPYRHIDRTQVHRIVDLNADMPYVQVKGIIKNMRLIGQGRAQRLVADIQDQSGSMELVWFQGIKWVKERIKEGHFYLAFGKPTQFGAKINMAHPTLDTPEEVAEKRYLQIMPLYNATERMKAKALDTKALMKLTHQLVFHPQFQITENLPEYIIRDLQLMPRQQAFVQIHFPENNEQLLAAQQRLKFEELFFIQFKLLHFKQVRTEQIKGIQLGQIGSLFNDFYNHQLPFELTQAQKRVIKEIRADVRTGKQMNRLVQGDVGSGKTVVALMSMLMANDNGYQACMMAPTEILAQQHFETLTKLLGDLPVSVRLLTGSTGTKARKEILEMAANGKLQILVGTHALIEDKVKFHNLALAVIDEQHRFGVQQRARLWKKNQLAPHILVMTATPIPRTLAMTLYGDLDVSVIDELPAGRKPIQTQHRFESSRLRIIGFMREQIKKGRQVYVVYPLIEESEKLDYMNLQTGFESLLKHFPMPEYTSCIVHGRLSATDKEREMQRFVRGEAQIMVATTVIEVGVNVPNASVMIIESAERFGLSQLHQLRGRVGRGAEQSYCILMTDYKLSADAKLRMETMCNTNNGFEIAEVDLKLRGPGDLQGTQQSGVLDLKLADLAKDYLLLQQARNYAQKIIEQDPQLISTDNTLLRTYFDEYNKQSSWSRIS
jgi:ATP-dependent DNA helicase RecG